MVHISTVLLLFLQVHLSTQYFANLCFNRKRVIDCTPEGRAYVGGIMEVRSITMLLSSDARRLQMHNNGRTCTAVEFECRAVMRNNTRAEINDRTMLAVYDYILRTCNGKTNCYLEVPNWNSVNGTTNSCRERFPDIDYFHLRGVYIDFGCQLPMPTTTMMTAQSNDTNTTMSETTTGTITLTNETPQSTKPISRNRHKPTADPILRRGKKGKFDAVESSASHIGLPLILLLVSALPFLSLH